MTVVMAEGRRSKSAATTASHNFKIILPANLSALEHHLTSISGRIWRMRPTQRRARRQWRNHLQRLNPHRARRVTRCIATSDADAANSALFYGAAQDLAERSTQHFCRATFEFSRNTFIRPALGGMNDDAAVVLEKLCRPSRRAPDFCGRSFRVRQRDSVQRHFRKTMFQRPRNLPTRHRRATARTDE